MMPNELTVDGVKYQRVDRIANRVSCWGMFDCHAFERFEGPTIDAVFEDWKAFCEDARDSKYGMPSLCPVIVLEDQKELRRVGKIIDFDKPQEYRLWLDPVRADPDIARLLAESTSGSELCGVTSLLNTKCDLPAMHDGRHRFTPNPDAEVR